MLFRSHSWASGGHIELRDGRYPLRAKQTDGTLRSVALPDFSIPVRACFDRTLNLQVLLQIAQAAG